MYLWCADSRTRARAIALAFWYNNGSTVFGLNLEICKRPDKHLPTRTWHLSAIYWRQRSSPRIFASVCVCVCICVQINIAAQNRFKYIFSDLTSVFRTSRWKIVPLLSLLCPVSSNFSSLLPGRSRRDSLRCWTRQRSAEVILKNLRFFTRRATSHYTKYTIVAITVIIIIGILYYYTFFFFSFLSFSIK